MNDKEFARFFDITGLPQIGRTELGTLKILINHLIILKTFCVNGALRIYFGPWRRSGLTRIPQFISQSFYFIYHEESNHWPIIWGIPVRPAGNLPSAHESTEDKFTSFLLAFPQLFSTSHDFILLFRFH